MRSRRRITIALVLTVATLGAACVKQDPPGLSISELEAKLVFGIDDAPEPGLNPAEATLQIPGPGSGGLFLRDGSKITRRPYLGITGPAAMSCPGARNAGIAQFGATDNVNTNGQGNRPEEGVYPWRIMRSSGEGSELELDKLTPGGYELRAIRNVAEVPRDQWSANPTAPSNREVFTFEEVRNLSFYEDAETSEGRIERLVERFLITTYQVDTAGLRARPSQTDVAVQLPSQGDPERGVSMLRSITVDGAGLPVAGIDPFEPANGLSLMGLPFVTNETFVASATDTSHGRTITNETTVGSRDRFNACGDEMDAFPASSTQTVSSTESASELYEVEYWIAPQHGGVVILEDVYHQTSGQRVLLHRASLHPTGPVPADGLPR